MKNLILVLLAGTSLIAVGMMSDTANASMAEKAATAAPKTAKKISVSAVPAATKWKRSNASALMTAREKQALLQMQRTRKVDLSAWQKRTVRPGLNLMQGDRVVHATEGVYKGVVTDIVIDSRGRTIAIAGQFIRHGKLAMKDESLSAPVKIGRNKM